MKQLSSWYEGLLFADKWSPGVLIDKHCCVLGMPGFAGAWLKQCLTRSVSAAGSRGAMGSQEPCSSCAAAGCQGSLWKAACGTWTQVEGGDHCGCGRSTVRKLLLHQVLALLGTASLSGVFNSGHSEHWQFELEQCCSKSTRSVKPG